jgi:hypothetical protein
MILVISALMKRCYFGRSMIFICERDDCREKHLFGEKQTDNYKKMTASEGIIKIKKKDRWKI